MNRFVWVLLGLPLFAVMSVRAQDKVTFTEEFREKFTETINAYYTPYLEYKLDRTLDETRLVYHTHINCLFHQAIIQSKNDTNYFFSRIFEEKRVSFSPKPLNLPANRSACPNLKSVFNVQRMKGFQTACDLDGSLNEKSYSPCRLYEMVWNEWGAYHEFLYQKSRDAENGGSLLREAELEKGSENDILHVQKYVEKIQAQAQYESTIGIAILQEAMRRYTIEMIYYRNALWMGSLAFVVNSLRYDLIGITEGAFAFITKFSNAAQE